MRPGHTLIAAGLLGLTGVAAGAFGAHALADAVSARDLEIWKTGAHYQQLHAAALLAVGLWGAEQPAATLRAATVLFVIGILVFSGTLYAMVLGGPRMLGAVTPLGGLCLMAAWGAVLAHGLRRLKPR